MNRPQFLAVSFMLLLVPGGYAGAQVAGSSRVGITIEETREVAIGWSAKKQILRQPVYNEQKQKVGIVDDLIERDGPLVDDCGVTGSHCLAH